MSRTLVVSVVLSGVVASLVTLGGSALIFAPTTRAEAPPQQAGSAPPVVRAQRFELVDAQGRVLAHLGQEPATGSTDLVQLPGRVSLEFLDEQGEPRALIAMADGDAPAITVLDAEGAALVLSAAGPSGGTASPGGVSLAMGSAPDQPGQRGRVRTGLTLLPSGQSSLQFADAEGRLRMTLGVASGGTPVTDVRTFVAPPTSPPPVGSLPDSGAAQQN